MSIRDLVGPEGHRTPVAIVAGADIAKGDMVLIGGTMYGVAYAAIANGATGVVYVQYDRVEVDKASATVITTGQKLFIDPATGLALDVGTGTGKECGVVTKGAGAGATTIEAIFYGAKTV